MSLPRAEYGVRPWLIVARHARAYRRCLDVLRLKPKDARYVTGAHMLRGLRQATILAFEGWIDRDDAQEIRDMAGAFRLRWEEVRDAD